MKMKDMLSSDLKQAQKSRDSLKIDTLRLLLSEIQNKEIDLRKDIENKDILSILTTQIKKRREAASLYEKNGRMDLHDKEMKESGILESYLPEQVGDEQLRDREDPAHEDHPARDSLGILDVESDRVAGHGALGCHETPPYPQAR